jgi:cytochrome c
MKAALLPVNVFLLTLVISCTQQTQSKQNAQQGEQAKSQALPSLAKSERGTPAEARAMLQKAVEHYNSVGRKQALVDFTGKKPPFVDRDLYVVCIGSDHKITANGGFPQYVGMSPDVLKGADGKAVGKAIWEIGDGKGEGSVQYQWINPATGKVEPKVIFAQKVGEDVCGVGAYNPQ